MVLFLMLSTGERRKNRDVKKGSKSWKGEELIAVREGKVNRWVNFISKGTGNPKARMVI